MTKTALVATFGLLFAGGATAQTTLTTWYKQGDTQKQFYVDSNPCAFEAERAVATSDPRNPRARSTNEAIGQGNAAGMDAATRKNAIYRNCMQAKGHYGGGPRAQTQTHSELGDPIPPAPVSAPKPEDPFEKVLRTANCLPVASPRITTVSAKFESYKVACSDGHTLTMNCRPDGCYGFK